MTRDALGKNSEGRMKDDLNDRGRLARETSHYFAELDDRAAKEENCLARDLAAAATCIDLDTTI